MVTEIHRRIGGEKRDTFHLKNGHTSLASDPRSKNNIGGKDGKKKNCKCWWSKNHADNII